MQAHELVGLVLVAGLAIFLIGAGGWKRAYDQPLIQALPVIHVDRRRRAWIHLWIIPAMFLTSAGVLGLAAVAGPRPWWESGEGGDDGPCPEPGGTAAGARRAR